MRIRRRSRPSLIAARAAARRRVPRLLGRADGAAAPALAAWICAGGAAADARAVPCGEPSPRYQPRRSVAVDELALGRRLRAVGLLGARAASCWRRRWWRRRWPPSAAPARSISCAPRRSSPLALVAGLVVGAPARLYLLCAGPLALHVVAALAGVIPLDDPAGVAGGARRRHGAPRARRPRAWRWRRGRRRAARSSRSAWRRCSAWSASLPRRFACDRTSVRWAFLHPAGALDAAMLAHDGLWRRMVDGRWALDTSTSRAIAGALALVPLASVAGVAGCSARSCSRAACRKLASPQLPLFCKPQAVALFALVAAARRSCRSAPRDRRRASTPAWRLRLLGLLLLPVVGVRRPVRHARRSRRWALALRRRRAACAGRATTRAPHRAVWLHAGAVRRRCCSVLLGDHRHARPRCATSTLVASPGRCSLAATLPIYLLFAIDALRDRAARWAFGVAVGAHLLFQIIAIGMMHRQLPRRSGRLRRDVGARAAWSVPAWVLFRQRRCAAACLAGASSAEVALRLAFSLTCGARWTPSGSSRSTCGASSRRSSGACSGRRRRAARARRPTWSRCRRCGRSRAPCPTRPRRSPPRSGMQHHFEPATPWGGGDEGLAILSRHPIAERARARAAARRADGAAPGARASPSRRRRARRRRSPPTSTTGSPTAASARIRSSPATSTGGRGRVRAAQDLMGDFNATPDSDEIRFLRGLHSIGGQAGLLSGRVGAAPPGRRRRLHLGARQPVHRRGCAGSSATGASTTSSSAPCARRARRGARLPHRPRPPRRRRAACRRTTSASSPTSRSPRSPKTRTALSVTQS